MAIERTPYADARQTYEDGMSLKRLRLRFHLAKASCATWRPRNS